MNWLKIVLAMIIVFMAWPLTYINFYILLLAFFVYDVVCEYQIDNK